MLTVAVSIFEALGKYKFSLGQGRKYGQDFLYSNVNMHFKINLCKAWGSHALSS